VNKSLGDVRIVVSGAGAAGTAIVTLLLAADAGDVVVVDREGALSADDTTLAPAHLQLAGATNPRRATGGLHDVLVDADVFIGVSAPGILAPAWIDDMADAIVFALANPDPEVDPAEAGKRAAVVASGRSDYPNQINNVLPFPMSSAACWTPGPRTSPWRCCCEPPRRSPSSSPTRSSTPPSSSPPCSTPTSPSRLPPPCRTH
jgi:malate dehydrogenase (oxaloacetate-decarboxylating)